MRGSVFVRFLITILVSLLLGLTSSQAIAQGGCPVPPMTGQQRYPSAIAVSMEQASQNLLSTGGSSPAAPELPQIWKGYPPTQAKLVRGYVPCTVLKAIAYQESPQWKQFIADYGQIGSTLITSDCGYGIMQITGPPIMTGEDPQVNRIKVTGEDIYNVATGARVLVQKWNATQAYVGANDPSIAEHWYFAVWAYNGVTSNNNPNNNCPPSNATCEWANNPFRPLFTGSQPKSWYPYQELIWGYAGNPPNYIPPLNPNTKYWIANTLTLPDRQLIVYPPSGQIPSPTPTHADCRRLYLPTARND